MGLRVDRGRGILVRNYCFRVLFQTSCLLLNPVLQHEYAGFVIIYKSQYVPCALLPVRLYARAYTSFREIRLFSNVRVNDWLYICLNRHRRASELLIS